MFVLKVVFIEFLKGNYYQNYQRRYFKDMLKFICYLKKFMLRNLAKLNEKIKELFQISI